jgi:EmrB/QacA subfamily drug resistance transporter
VTATDPALTTDGAAPLTKRQLYVMFAGVMTGMALAALDGTIVNTALTTIVGELGGVTAYAWVGTAYLLTSTAATPLFGKLSDLYGRRLLFEIAIGTFVVGSLLCGVAQDMTQLVVARGVQGVGGGGLFALTFTIIGDAVSPRERGRYVGFITSVFTVCSVIGPLLGGFFVDHLTWRWIFLVNVPLGAVAMAVSHRALRLPFVRQQRAIDYVGAALVVGAVTALVLALSWTSDEFGWTSGATLGLGILTVVLTTAFVWWEGRTPEPIIPLRLLHIDVVRTVVPLVAIATGVMFGANAFLPLFLQGVTGVSPTQSGLLLIPFAVGVAGSATLIGRRTTATGRYKIWPIVGTASASVGLCCFLLLDDSALGIAAALVGMVFLGVGLGGIMPTGTLAVQNAIEWQDLGAGTSLVTFMRSLGGAVGLAAYGAVFNANLDSNVPNELVRAPREIRNLPPAQRDQALDVLANAIVSTFRWALPVMLGAFVLSFFVPERPLRGTSAMQRGHADH